MTLLDPNRLLAQTILQHLKSKLNAKMGEGNFVINDGELEYRENVLLMNRLYGQSFVLLTEIIGTVLKTEDKVQDAAELLKANGHVVQEIRSRGNCLAITEDGAIALRDKFYTREAKERLNNSIYDFTKWALPIATLLLTILIFIFQTSTKADVKQARKEVQELDKRVRQLEH